MFKKYFNNDASISDKEFPRKIMLLNVARLEVYEPMTYDGGIKGYDMVITYSPDLRKEIFLCPILYIFT